MRFIEAENYDEMSRITAGILRDLLIEKPDSVFALPTGSTPIGTYARLAYLHKTEGLDFSKATFFNVDEYVGMGPDSELGYAHFLWENLYKDVNTTPAHVYAPDGLSSSPERAAREYQERIDEAGGLDVAFLGLGRNGHIGFNEPAHVLRYPAHCVELTQSTIDANARFFADAREVPRHAITIGIGTIMQARTIVLIASGADKQDAVKRLRDDLDVSPEFPASVLHLHHNAVAVTAA